MYSLEELRRQIRIAALAIGVVIPVGVLGFMILESLNLLDAVWLTLVTLTTIGYGDIVPKTPAGRIFTIFLILTGLSIVAFALQAIFTFFVSPTVRDLRRQRRQVRIIQALDHHYIICGYGELVEQTINSVMRRAKSRLDSQINQRMRSFDRALRLLFGNPPARFPRLHKTIRAGLTWYMRQRFANTTLVNVAVVITTVHTYAEHLRREGLLVIEGDPSDDHTLEMAGVKRARAMAIMLEQDEDTLLSTLTARSHNPNLFIVTALLEQKLTEQMIRAGANRVVEPYEFAGQFLNNTTLRPVVNDFFTAILFDHEAGVQTTQIRIVPGSPWIGEQLGSLNLREQFKANIIGMRHSDGQYNFAPDADEILDEQEHLIIVAPTDKIGSLLATSKAGVRQVLPPKEWQETFIPKDAHAETSVQSSSLREATEKVRGMRNHYVIIGMDRVGRNAIHELNPNRPFVIISNDNNLTSELLRKGFMVIHGDPTDEPTLKSAGIEQALAVMISLEDRASSLLTVINCRSLSKRLLITATATSDEMVAKLKRAGADRITSPFHVAGQFVMLATTRPAVSGFFQYVLFNTEARIETTELYMQDDSLWIGRSIGELGLKAGYRAGVIGVRLANGTFLYAPPETHLIGAHEVLIVVTPMEFADELREMAHGTSSRRPRTLRLPAIGAQQKS